jgi:hypothetical protein
MRETLNNGMATITGATVTQHGTGAAIAADCFGNNAAIQCPGCKYPILLTARPNQRGSDAQHPVACPSCGRATWMLSSVADGATVTQVVVM